MTIFDQTETRSPHYDGKFVKYDNKTLAIGGTDGGSMVEELNRSNLAWADHPMSPVNDSSTRLYDFTTLTVEKSLFIFHHVSVLEWNGTSWKTLEEELCRNRVGHTTFVYAGEIYHMGGRSENDSDLYR